MRASLPIPDWRARRPGKSYCTGDFPISFYGLHKHSLPGLPRERQDGGLKRYPIQISPRIAAGKAGGITLGVLGVGRSKITRRHVARSPGRGKEWLRSRPLSRIRTCSPQLRTLLLYPLSYEGHETRTEEGAAYGLASAGSPRPSFCLVSWFFWAP